MTDRIVEIAEGGARLSIRHGLLCIEREGADLFTIPPRDLSCLVLGHPRIELTHPTLAELAASGASVVVTDDKHLPAALMVPYVGHSTQSERMRLQADAPLPLRKRLWQTVVRTKIEAQGALLLRLRNGHAGLPDLAREVRSGDPENLEGQAAARYWRALFGPDFRRERQAEDENRYLNYGYTVLRAIVARAVCGAGLHPSLGIHHHNRYDPFPLVDDLMEPFRPLVDEAVYRLAGARGVSAPLDRESRGSLISALLVRIKHAGEERTLFDLAARMAASLARSFESREAQLEVPTVF